MVTLCFFDFYQLLSILDSLVLRNKLIEVEILLKNHCPFSNRYFAVEVRHSGKKIDFSGNRLMLRLQENSQIRLAISDLYSDFQYSDGYRKIRHRMALVADCGEDRTMEEAFKSVNKAFR